MSSADSHIPAKTKLEHALQRYEERIRQSGKNPTDKQQLHLERERMHIESLADLTQKLEDYYKIVDEPQYNLLKNDEHLSERLGKNMRATGRPKPTERYDAHAIVSGGHAKAAAARITLAMVRVGLDDPVNGAWLPRAGNDAKRSNCWATPGAAPHSRTHRNSYYDWITNELRPFKNVKQQKALKDKLRSIGTKLETGKEIPEHIKEEMRYADLQSS
ncbi:AHH domain-containing protein [Endozoicomonas arenosclerae]|uniref:AHH domain-containing protein n=1 Tax=Endozoicomonas arenosclerae TaxID=1633495 RepID=UPI0007853C3D|nr:AHH domain-containing protein [Endozoicomonas arenosclerae]